MIDIKKHIDLLPNTRSILWAILSMLICITLVVAANYHKNSNLNSIVFHLPKKDNSKTLVSKGLIEKLISGMIPNDFQNVGIIDLDLKLIERIIERDSRIKNAEVYIDGSKKLHIEVEEREPVLRVKNKSGEDYYIDEHGNKIALLENVSIRVPVVTGYINSYSNEWRDIKAHNMHDVHRLANVLREDDVLKALVEQVNFDKNGYITLIPKVGREEIKIGSTEELELKVDLIKNSYKHILRQDGWGAYKALNVDIPNQIRMEPHS